MNFIKTHLISLVSGLAGIVFITLAVLTINSNTVTAKMNNVKKNTNADSIRSLASNPKNQKVIDAEIDRGKREAAEVDSALKDAADFNKRNPLTEESSRVFPKPTEAAAPFRFVQKYREEFRQLAGPLEAGTAPTDSDVKDAVEDVLNLIAEYREKKEQEQVGDSKDTKPGQPPTAQPPPTVAPEGAPALVGDGVGRVGGGRVGGGVPDGSSGRGSTIGNFTLPPDIPKEPKFDPALRARVSRAKSIRCYIEEFTFHQSPIVDTSGKAPTPMDMWFAQVGLWIQKDVVEAIKSLNDEAVNKARQADPAAEPCVQDVPVKRLIAIRIHGYQTDKRVIPFPVYAALETRDTGVVSYRDSKCNDQFDVVTFSVAVVVDQREIQRLIDRITKANLYCCIKADYDQINRTAEENQGYMYGTAPVVRLTMEFEGFLSHDAFMIDDPAAPEPKTPGETKPKISLMPKEVAEAITGKEGGAQP